MVAALQAAEISYGNALCLGSDAKNKASCSGFNQAPSKNIRTIAVSVKQKHLVDSC